MCLQAYSGGKQREMAAIVKNIAQRYPEYFTAVKFSWSIVPELRINPELLKTIKSR